MQPLEPGFARFERLRFDPLGVVELRRQVTAKEGKQQQEWWWRRKCEKRCSRGCEMKDQNEVKDKLRTKQTANPKL